MRYPKRRLTGPIVSSSAAKSNLRRHIATALDGEYKHPAGGVIRMCGRCDGNGCLNCDFTGVFPDTNPKEQGDDCAS